MNGERRDRTSWMFLALILALFALSVIRRSADWVLQYEWWKELHQVDTLINTILYGFVPVMVVAAAAFAVLWMAHARGVKAAGTGLSRHPLYNKLATLGLLV
ncbi:MAG: UPF0182 family protein, partial [Bryobacterales bacterium]|nr:UPF0182 family protein [Bryobacterales bacterium]